MIAEISPKPHLRSPNLSYNKAGHEFLTSSPNKHPIRDKKKPRGIEWIACDLLPQRCIFLKQYTIGIASFAWCSIVRLSKHLLANTSQWRLPCPITLIAYIYQRVYIRLPRRDQGIVYLFVGQGNRHWEAFAKRCINSRTIRHDAKGAVPIVYCFRKMHLWGSKSHAVYSIPLCFYLGWSAYFETMSKRRVRPYNIIGQKGRLLRWGFGGTPNHMVCNGFEISINALCLTGSKH